jgi:hypothetical protein
MSRHTAAVVLGACLAVVGVRAIPTLPPTTTAGMAFCCGAGTKGGSCNDADLSALSLTFNKASAPTAVDISATVDGSKSSCPAEACKVASGKSAAVSFPSIGSNTDCLNKLLSGAGAAPSDLSVTLHNTKPATLSVTVQGGPDVTLKECSSALAGGERSASPMPKGAYCGGFQDIIKDLRISIVNTSAVNISASISPFGGKGIPVACDGEPVAYKPTSTGGGVALPGMSKPTDCLGKIFSKYGAPDITVVRRPLRPFRRRF